MVRAPSRRAKRAVRFREREALRAAVLERCRQEFREVFAREWTPSLERRYALAARTKWDDDEAGKLLARLQKLMVDIKGFHKNPAVREATARGEALFRTKVLFDWAESHRVLLGKFPRWDEKDLLVPLATARRWMLRRVHGGGPQFFDRLQPKNAITAKQFAVISLLAGNFPDIDETELTSEGFTVAEIIDLESKYLRKGIAGL